MENSEEQRYSSFLDIRNILKSIKKEKFLIVLVAMISAVLMLIVSVFFINPEYSSNTEILVNQKNNDNPALVNAQIQADTQMISTYKDIIQSPTILNKVNEKLLSEGYSTNASEIKQSISVTSEQSSQVFTISVKTHDPKLSAAIANTIATTFKNKIKSIMNINNVSILSKAQENANPVSPKILSNVLIGAVFGLILGIIIAVLKEVNDRTVKDEKELSLMGLNDLGIISEIPADKVKKMLFSRNYEKTTRSRASLKSHRRV